jgi:hypothetical protein
MFAVPFERMGGGDTFVVLLGVFHLHSHLRTVTRVHRDELYHTKVEAAVTNTAVVDLIADPCRNVLTPDLKAICLTTMQPVSYL